VRRGIKRILDGVNWAIDQPTKMAKAMTTKSEMLLIGLMLLLRCTDAFSRDLWIFVFGSSNTKKHVASELPTLAWSEPTPRGVQCRRGRAAIAGSRRFTSLTATRTTAEATSLLANAHVLTEWLQTRDPVAAMDTCTEVALFDGNLRGLKWICSDQLEDEPRVVATIPARKVLRSTYPSPTWDAQLAWQILEEHRKGSKSDYYPYIKFLTSDQPFSDDTCPAPLAPHAIRHWTKQQLDALSTTTAGRRLMALHEEQDALWRTKYDALRKIHSYNIPSWKHFAWAMEAVHSRAYLGASMEAVSTKSLAFTIAPPIVAAILGVLFAGATEARVPPQVVFCGLAVMASLPLISSMMRPPQKSAVLLPFIDVANHCAEAASTIRFDPLINSFDLVINPRRCVDQSNGQLFVSYGDKSDGELLLNYGFIPSDSPMQRDRKEYITVVSYQLLVAYELSKVF
jgi:hypothetical protein